jgi:serine protease Do
MQKRWTVYVLVIVLVALTVGFLKAMRRGADAPTAGGAQAASARADATSQTPVGTGGRSPAADAVRGQAMDTMLFRNIAKRENPVVVYITTQSRLEEPELTNFFGGDDFLRRFFGGPMPRRERLQRALGSGFLISQEGDILTNNHVIAGAEEIRVGLFGDDRKTYVATVTGRDPLTDSALIKIKDAPRNLPIATLGDSDALEPGDWVMAIGNPFRLGHTVTVGVVSYKGRPFAVTEGRFQNMLQTDASINPGNSGGPLINVHDEVVGINTAILAGEGAGGNIGIGFAVPINTVKSLLPQLRTGKVHRGRLGVQIQNMQITDEEAKGLGLPKPEGAIVSMVEHDSPAERAGIRAGDVIVAYNGKPVTDADHLTQMVSTTPAGTRVPITFYRNGKQETVTATIDELDSQSEEERRARGGSSKASFGLALLDLTPELARQLRLPPGTDGALVEDVEPFTAAADAGIVRGDVILEVNRQPVHSARDAARELDRVKPGQPAFVLLSRHGNRVFVEMRKE